jgi:tRNA nucleotidyltransferase (CCA-adding enzyme)
VVVLGDGLKFARFLADELGGAYKGFEKFKTAKIFLKNGRIDISSARKETYEKPAALPDVVLSGRDEDLFRRDFTINSMAVSINKEDFGTLFDPFGGASDLKKKILKTMHDRSFVDDPTRILRAVRFEARLGFKIEKRTLQFIRKALKENIFENLSGERIREELFILFKEQTPAKAMKRLEQLGVLRKINPGLRLDSKALAMFKTIGSSGRLIRSYYADVPIMYLMALLGTAQPAQALATAVKLKLSNDQRHAIDHGKELQKLPQKDLGKLGKGSSATYFLLKKYGTEALLYLMLMQKDKKRAAGIKRYLDELKHIKIEITGDDLKEMGIKEGPEYSKILSAVMKAKLDGRAETREEQLEFASTFVV